jgi:hypothetical protein
MATFLMKLAYLSKVSQWAHAVRAHGGFKQFGADRREMYEFVFQSQQLDGPIDYLEFGVAGGDSIRWWVSRNTHPKSRFAGFDTFTGLPEQWGHVPQGAFSQGGEPPKIGDPRCSFLKGLFQDTLPGFLSTFCSTRKLVVHLDADLYSSTLYVLASLASRLKPDDLLIFDEFVALTNPVHEFRAFEDFTNAFAFQSDLIAATEFLRGTTYRVRKA